MNNQVSHLLSRYFSSEISRKEYSCLRNSLDNVNDEELLRMISEQWYQFEANKKHDVPAFSHITHQIGFEQKSSASRATFGWHAAALKIAAMFLLPFFMALSAYFYFRDNPGNVFASRQYSVAMSNGDRGEVVLPDGTKVYLNSATTISYPADFGKKTRTITLNGEAMLQVVKDKTKPFLVETKLMTVKVLGTTFNVRAYDSDSTTETSLIEGSVKITTKQRQPRILTLEPNQKAVMDLSDGKAYVEKTDLYSETAWRRGELIFRSSTFDEIAKELEIFYGVEITLQGQANRGERFSGTFQEGNLGAALRILQQHYSFSYSIVGSNAKIIFH